MKLRIATSARWLRTVLADTDAFLIDHAACERKASATAMSLVAHYRDRRELVVAMIAVAREELEHFQQVYDLLDRRGVMLGVDIKDPYVNALKTSVRHGPDEYLLDRLLVGSIVEARGCERFGMIASEIEDDELKSFYSALTRSESRHAACFLRLARRYFKPDVIKDRLDTLLDVEAAIIEALPLRPALH
jgi:tRNA 2-(methylsulfanyl)-N6-isopentenyladenosine37 hydroxylase